MSALVRRRLLAVLAHPDDETFGCGGLLAKYASEGVQVSLICATRGEVGEISDPSLATPENLAQVREGELRAACEALGVNDLFILGYRDSGMAGTQDNEHPEALCRADLQEVSGRVLKIIRETRPQVVVTFDPNGGYGHPDHILIHHATRRAFAAARDGGEHVEASAQDTEPYRPLKLYYAVFPRSMVRAFRQAMIDAGIQSDFTDLDPESIGVADEDVTTVLDVGNFVERKEAAARCHRTQIEGNQPFAWIPEDIRVRFLSTEYFVRAEPPPQGGSEDDLFSDIPIRG